MRLVTPLYAASLLAGLTLLGCRTKDADTPLDSDTPVGDDTGQVVDADGDGSPASEDCDDADAGVYPGAVELCDGLDNNCDGGVDEGVLVTVYADADDDGYGDDATATEACAPGEGQVTQGADCDDSDAAYNPGAAEDDCADPNDYNCDGSVGYADGDGDGFAACEECDDADAAVNPDAAEVCDAVDNNCDGAVDEGVTTTYWADADGDGYGDLSAATEDCELPTGYAENADDCDDDEAAVNPAATEVCDGVDDDCDGLIDDADDSVDLSTGGVYYDDLDGDGYGDPSASTAACDQPSSTVTDSSDCDDGDAAINPAATEVCDEADNDCDGLIDDADGSLDSSTGDTFYADVDGDGYGDAGSALLACEVPSGAVEDDSDCDDGDLSINPGEEDVCDGLDNDCDGVTDPTGVDTDGDGTYNCLDSTVYSYDFDDGAWTDWATVDLGGGNAPSWSMSGGAVSEGSNAARSIAYGPDLGALDTYTVTVDIRSNGGANNTGGIAFAFDGSQDYWLAAWDDPNDYYGSYSPGGAVLLRQCVAGTCTTVASDVTTGYSQSASTWITMAVQVDGADIEVYFDGVLAVSYSHTSAPVGADYVGVYTFDNDSRIYYDNFEVTNP